MYIRARENKRISMEWKTNPDPFKHDEKEKLVILRINIWKTFGLSPFFSPCAAVDPPLHAPVIGCNGNKKIKWNDNFVFICFSFRLFLVYAVPGRYWKIYISGVNFVLVLVALASQLSWVMILKNPFKLCHIKLVIHRLGLLLTSFSRLAYCRHISSVLIFYWRSPGESGILLKMNVSSRQKRRKLEEIKLRW